MTLDVERRWTLNTFFSDFFGAHVMTRVVNKVAKAKANNVKSFVVRRRKPSGYPERPAPSLHSSHLWVYIHSHL